MHPQLALERVRSAVWENSFVITLRRAKTAIHNRWLALSFARRFYREACQAEPLALASQPPVPALDFTESLIQRSVPPRLHLLLQLRVASQLASINETKVRSRMCHEVGLSSEQIGAALLRNLNGNLSDPEKLLLRYADDMTRTPIDVDLQVIKQLRSCFSQSDLVELTAAIAHENFRIRFAEATRRLR